MSLSPQYDPSGSQVLANLGNRYVVFGPEVRRTDALAFDPDRDAQVLPRVADESEAAESRIVQSLRVSGASASAAPQDVADLALQDERGNKVLIDVKVRERDPRRGDMEAAQHHAAKAAEEGAALQTWWFNIDRPKLTIMHYAGAQWRIDELVPLDVWEKSAEGLYRRSQVVDELEDWLQRISALYGLVQEWLGDRPELRCEQSRSVTMSEQLMQQFAVTDREVPILDIMSDENVAASFIPRGLWLTGSWGRVDIITERGTSILHALRKVPNEFEWRLFPSDRRSLPTAFDKTTLLGLMRPA
jgi:hypothetical protein